MGDPKRRMQRERQKGLRRVSIRAAKAQGCVCDVQISFVDNEHGIDECKVMHDDWCPLLRVMEERPPGLARSQAVIYDPKGISET